MTTEGRIPSGILLVDKPRGISSAAAVAKAKNLLGGVKVGHLGTLDPFATGLLPLCIGEGTKVAPYLNLADKAYTGVIKLGVTTDTLDMTGTVLSESSAPDLGSLDLAALEAAFTGTIEQIPPAFSAIKRQGVPMYRLARTGQMPRMEPRTVRIDHLSLTARDHGYLEIRVRCSKGTYVRSLARDIGERIGCGATLEELVRTGFGRFELKDAVDLVSVEGDPQGVRRLVAAILPLCEALAELRCLTVDAVTARQLRQGQQQALARVAEPSHVGETARLVDMASELVAVVSERNGRWQLDRVFAPVPRLAPHDRPC